MPTLDAPIVAVTVYTNRARVTRRGRIQLAAGDHTLALTPVPETLEHDSVRASGTGAHARILGVDVITRYGEATPQETVNQLTRELEQLQDQERALADQDSALAARQEFLKSLGKSGAEQLSKGMAFGRSGIETVDALAQYLTREQDALAAARRQLAQQRRELARQISAAQARLGQAQHHVSNSWREIQVAVEVSAATEVELEVTYAVYGASWESTYDLRLVEGTVALTYLAMVSQQSGEDWPAVELALSTARPATSTSIPELQPWYLDIPRPMPLGGAMMKRELAADAMMDEEAVLAAPAVLMAESGYGGAPMAPPAAPIQQATASVEQSGAAVTYRVARPVAIPSDGTPHRTTVTTIDLGARLDYVSVPKLADETYQRATITNTSAFTLLAGTAAIFHGAEFVGRTHLSRVAPGEEFEVQLGIDDRITIERELTRRHVDKTLIGNTRRTVFAYRIKVTNLLDRQAKVTVLDQLPVARHEVIKVKLQDAAPKPSQHSDLNILRWDLTIEPQRSQELTFSFVVEHPRDQFVYGLEA